MLEIIALLSWTTISPILLTILLFVQCAGCRKKKQKKPIGKKPATDVDKSTVAVNKPKNALISPGPAQKQMIQPKPKENQGIVVTGMGDPRACQTALVYLPPGMNVDAATKTAMGDPRAYQLVYLPAGMNLDAAALANNPMLNANNVPDVKQDDKSKPGPAGKEEGAKEAQGIAAGLAENNNKQPITNANNVPDVKQDETKPGPAGKESNREKEQCAKEAQGIVAGMADDAAYQTLADLNVDAVFANKSMPDANNIPDVKQDQKSKSGPAGKEKESNREKEQCAKEAQGIVAGVADDAEGYQTLADLNVDVFEDK